MFELCVFYRRFLQICAVETMKAICQNYAFSSEKNNDIFNILNQLKPISVYGCVSDNRHTSPLMEGCLKLRQYSLKYSRLKTP